MTDAHRFAVDVLRIVCDRFEQKAADIRLLAESTSSFEEWLTYEAFLACKVQQDSREFCEVVVKPPYGGNDGEGVIDADSNPFLKRGDLRVGATYEKGDHRWVFAEFVLLHDGKRNGDEWQRTIEKKVSRLKRLGWVNSISLLVSVCVSVDTQPVAWEDSLKGFAGWNRPALAEPFSLALPGGGSLVVKAFDIKRNESDCLTC